MKYYKILIIAIFILFISFLFWKNTDEKIDKLDIFNVIKLNDLNFAGEKIPTEGEHYFNKEKLSRELSITRFNIYQFILYHKREPIYFPIIEKKLKEAGIPDDFKYLAVAESGLRNDALSNAQAGGIWQFIPETGRRYGLIIDENVDERYHFEKATDAAVKYINKLHEDFGDWTLAAAAYNRGENGLKRALDDQGVKSYYDLYLNEETSRYIFRIAAIKYTMQKRYELFSEDELGEQFVLPKTKTIKVQKIENIKKWASENGYIYANIKELNPWIKGESLNNGDWEIKVFDY